MLCMNKHHKVERNIGIDLVRGIAISYIVGYWHLFSYTHAFPQYCNDGTSRLTLIMLGVFVLASGYLVGLKERFNTRKDVSLYYIRKLLRIYPLYSLAIILFLVLGISNFVTLAKALFLLSMFYPPAPHTLWFVTMIMVFYVLSPLLIYRNDDLKRYLFVSTFILLLMLFYAYFTHLLDIRIAMYFPAFALGILIAIHKRFFLGIHFGAVVFMFASSLGISLLKADSETLSEFMDVPMIVTGSFAFFVAMLRVGKYIHGRRAIELLSYCSFCMYLFHRPVFTVVQDIYFPKEDANQVIYLVLVCLPLIVLISWLIQRTYDHIVGQLARRHI